MFDFLPIKVLIFDQWKSHKMAVYEKAGVREYWIVNPADKVLEQYLLKDQSGVKRLGLL